MILDNIRSAHNVGAIIRNAAAFGVAEIVCCGITPYPKIPGDTRLPHVAKKADSQIEKTSLGSSQHCHFRHYDLLDEAILSLSPESNVYALEIASEANNLTDFQAELPAALILGSEVDGIDLANIEKLDAVLQIPTTENKQSLNVTSACAISLYHISTTL